MTENALFLLPALRRARDLIDRDYAEPLDLDAMAAEAGYSRYHFARAFTTAYGETPRAYLTRRRIERAKTLLRTANLSVTEICCSSNCMCIPPMPIGPSSASSACCCRWR